MYRAMSTNSTRFFLQHWFWVWPRTILVWSRTSPDTEVTHEIAWITYILGLAQNVSRSIDPKKKPWYSKVEGVQALCLYFLDEIFHHPAYPINIFLPGFRAFRRFFDWTDPIPSGFSGVDVCLSVCPSVLLREMNVWTHLKFLQNKGWFSFELVLICTRFPWSFRIVFTNLQRVGNGVLQCSRAGGSPQNRSLTTTEHF